jgi:hypothetical protein
MKGPGSNQPANALEAARESASPGMAGIHCCAPDYSFYVGAIVLRRARTTGMAESTELLGLEVARYLAFDLSLL